MITDQPKFARVLENSRDLSPQEQLDLLEEIAALLRASLPSHSSTAFWDWKVSGLRFGAALTTKGT